MLIIIIIDRETRFLFPYTLRETESTKIYPFISLVHYSPQNLISLPTRQPWHAERRGIAAAAVLGNRWHFHIAPFRLVLDDVPTLRGYGRNLGLS